MLQCLSIIYFVILIGENVNFFCSPLNYENDLSSEPLSKISSTRSNDADKIDTSENYKSILLNCFRKLTNRCNYEEASNDTSCNLKKKSRRYFTGVGLAYQNISKQEKPLEGNDFNDMSKLMISGSGSNSSVGEMFVDYGNATADEISETSSAKAQRFWNKFNKHDTKHSLASDRYPSTYLSLTNETISTLDSFSQSVIQSFSTVFEYENETTEKQNLWNVTLPENIESVKTEETKMNFTSNCSCSYQNVIPQYNCSNGTQIVLTTPFCDIISYLIEDEESAPAAQYQRERKWRNKNKTKKIIREKILVCADSEDMINEDQRERDSPDLVAVHKKSLVDLNDSFQNLVNTSKNVSYLESDDITSQLLKLHKGLELKQNDQIGNASFSNKIVMRNPVFTGSINNSKRVIGTVNELMAEKMYEQNTEQSLKFVSSCNISDSESDIPLFDLKNGHLLKVDYKLSNFCPNLVNFKNRTHAFCSNVLKGVNSSFVTLRNKNKVITSVKSNKKDNKGTNSKEVISSQKKQNLLDDNKILSKSVSKGLFYTDFVNYQPYSSKKRKKLLLEIQNNLSSLQALKTETKELKEQFNYLKDELLKPLLLKNQTSKFNFNHLDDAKSLDDLNSLHQFQSNELYSTALDDNSTEKVFIKELNVVFNDPATTDGSQEIRILQDSVMGTPEKTNQYFVKEEKFKEIPSDLLSNKSKIDDGIIQILTISEVNSDQNNSNNKNNTDDSPTTCEVIYKIIESSDNIPIENAVTDFDNIAIVDTTNLVPTPDTLCISCQTSDYMEAETISDADYSDTEGLEDVVFKEIPRLLEKAVTKVDKTADSESTDETVVPMITRKKLIIPGEIETTGKTVIKRKTEEFRGNQVKEFGKYTESGQMFSTSKNSYLDVVGSSDTECTTDNALRCNVSTDRFKSSFSNELESTVLETVSPSIDECIRIETCPPEYSNAVGSKRDNTPSGGITDNTFSESSRLILENSERIEIECRSFVSLGKTIPEGSGLITGNSEFSDIENKTFIKMGKTAEVEETSWQQNTKPYYSVDSNTSELIAVGETIEQSETQMVTEVSCQRVGDEIQCIVPKTLKVKMTDRVKAQEFMSTEISDVCNSTPALLPEGEQITTTKPNCNCKIIPVIFSIKTQILTNVSAQVEEYNPSAKIKIINVTDSSNSSVQSSNLHLPFRIDSIKNKPSRKIILTKEMKNTQNKEHKLTTGESKAYELAKLSMKNLVANNTLQNRIPISLVTDIELEPLIGYDVSNRSLTIHDIKIFNNKSHAINRKSTENHTVYSNASLKPFSTDINVYHLLQTPKILKLENKSKTSDKSKISHKSKFDGIGKSTTKINEHFNFKTTLKKTTTSNLIHQSLGNPINSDSFKNILAKNISYLLKNKNLIQIGNLLDPLIKIPVSYFDSLNNSNENNQQKVNVGSKPNQNTNNNLVSSDKTKNESIEEIKKNYSTDTKRLNLLLPADTNDEVNRDINKEKKDVILKDNFPKKYKKNFTIQISFIDKSELDLQNSSTNSSDPVLDYKKNINSDKIFDKKTFSIKPDRPELPDCIKNKSNKNGSEIKINGKGCDGTNIMNYRNPLFQIQENYNQNHNENSISLDPVTKVNNCGQLNDSRYLNYLSLYNNISDENRDSIEGIDPFYLSSGTKPKESQNEELVEETSSKSESDLPCSSTTENCLNRAKEDTKTYNIHITKAIDTNLGIDNFKTNKIQILQPFKISCTKSSVDVGPGNGADISTTKIKCIQNGNDIDDRSSMVKVTKQNCLQSGVGKDPELMKEVLYGSYDSKRKNNCITQGITTTIRLTTTIKPHLAVKLNSLNYTLLPNDANDCNDVINYIHKTADLNKVLPLDPSHNTKLKCCSTKSFLEVLKLKNNCAKTAQPKGVPTKCFRNKHKFEENEHERNYYNNNFPLFYNDKIFRQYINLKNQPVVPNNVGLKNSSTSLKNKKVETNKLISLERELGKPNLNNKIQINLADLKNKNYNSISYNNNKRKDIQLKNASESYQKNFIKKLIERNNLQLMNSNINFFNEQNRLLKNNQLSNVKNYYQVLDYKKNDLTNFNKNIELKTNNLFKDNYDTDLIKIDTRVENLKKTSVKSNPLPNKNFKLIPKVNAQKSDLNVHNKLRILPKNYLLYFTRPVISNGKDKFFIDNDTEKLKIINDKSQESCNMSRYFANNQMYNWNRLH